MGALAETSGDAPVRPGANAIANAFDFYQEEFKGITRRAKSRFEAREWHGTQQDAVERLDLYTSVIDQIVADIRNLLGNRAKDKSVWARMKHEYSRVIAARNDFELAETFFNSVTRRIFATVGVDPRVEFVDSDFEAPRAGNTKPVYLAYDLSETSASPLRWDLTRDLVRRVLEDQSFKVGFQNIELDASLVAQRINSHLRAVWGSTQMDAIEIARPVFYRNKGAYILGRLRRGSLSVPLALALLNTEQGILVDAVLLTEDEVSILFSFTRSYFHVEVDRPRELVAFLKSIMPLKPVAELYTSIGFNKHGKTELYRDLMRHLASSGDKFQIARGEKGMVMVVFTMPSYDVVFKVIKDRFSHPKTTTRQRVMGNYRFVFRHDRVGRLVDAQEFEHLKFDRARFSGELLEELRRVAGNSVIVEDNHVIINHLYTERRVTPLNLYLKEADEIAARDVVVDYGKAVKELASANIFPGDLLLKNFGVTRHGRVVFYDYDELCLLTDCVFRGIPESRSPDMELQAEPWFAVGDNDIFPEEFGAFLGLHGDLRDVFVDRHQDLFGVSFWRQMQERLSTGEIIDIFPYKQRSRLVRHQMS